MKQAIVLASFGVGDPRQRELCLASIAEEMTCCFSDWKVFEVYTSNFIRKRLAAAGEMVWSLTELLADLKRQGFVRVFVQPLHLTMGEEYEEKLVRPLPKLRADFAYLQLGKPVFSDTAEHAAIFSAALQAVFFSAALQPQEAVVFMGHGSPHRHNPAYERLQKLADGMDLPMHIGVLEPDDTPNFAQVLQRLQQHDVRQVLLRPLLLTGGRHVAEDMAGAQPDSWKCRLEEQGIRVRTDLRGLGEYPEFRRLYAQLIQKGIADRR